MNEDYPFLLIELDNHLFCPEGYPEADRILFNGCGPSSWKVDLVPDTILGVSFRESCNIHDFCYIIGETQSEKDFADRLFYWNMIQEINNKGGFFLLQKLRYKFAYKYYFAVSLSSISRRSFYGPWYE